MEGIRIGLWPVLAFLSAALAAGGCGSRHPAAKAHLDVAPADVRVVPAEANKGMAFEEVVGTVRAKTRAVLEAKVSGRIEAMPVLLGQRVKAGELLIRLAAPEVRARFEQATAALQQAERDWKRNSTLFEQDTVSHAERDKAESRLLEARAAAAEAKAMLGYLEVTAPFDGVVTHKPADVGDLAAPGKTLVEIEDVSVLQVEADIPEGIANRVKLGETLNVRLDPAGKSIPGVVEEFGTSADPRSRTFRVKVRLPQVEGLMTGRFARLLVPVAEREWISVPADAVVDRGQLEMVFVVQENRAVLHLVKTGAAAAGNAEILSGLDAGDLVVVNNAARLVDGQEVRVQQ